MPPTSSTAKAFKKMIRPGFVGFSIFKENFTVMIAKS